MGSEVPDCIYADVGHKNCNNLLEPAYYTEWQMKYL